MPKHTEKFQSPMAPEEVLDAFEALAREKGWKLKDRAAGAATAKKGVNLRSFGDEIALHVFPDEDGSTQVSLQVDSHQIADLGRSQKEITEAIHGRLS